jgi:hypothetical protein
MKKESRMDIEKAIKKIGKKHFEDVEFGTEIYCQADYTKALEQIIKDIYSASKKEYQNYDNGKTGSVCCDTEGMECSKAITTGIEKIIQGVGK